jgi:hypothetical protein
MPNSQGLSVTRIASSFKYLILTAYLVAVVYPLCWLFYTSGKSTQEFFRNPLGLPEAITQPGRGGTATLVSNYTNAWVGSHFSLYFLNSLKVVALSLALTLLLGSMAAYVLARFEFRGRALIQTLFISGLLIPMQLILIPLFFEFSEIGETLDRISNMYAPHERPMLWLRLSTTLRGVISQKLICRADQSGRVVAQEIMVVTPTISKLIEEGKSSDLYSAIRQGGQEDYWGMQTMNQCLEKLVAEDIITEDDALAKAGILSELKQTLRRSLNLRQAA